MFNGGCPEGEIPITNVNLFVLHNILTNGFHIMIICNVTVRF